MTAIGWRAVVPAIAATTVSVLPGFLTAGLAVQMSADLGLTLSGLGVLIGLFFAVSAATSPVMGRVVQRRGWPVGLRFSTLLAAATLAGIGWWATSATALGAWLALGGLASSFAHPASNLAVARCVPLARQGLLFGIKHAAVPTATLLAGLAVPALGLTVGWRWAFWGCAALGIATALAIPDPAPYELEIGSGERGEQRGPGTPLRLLIALAAAGVLGIGGIDALASFIVTYAADTGVAEGAAGLLLAVGSIAGIAIRLSAGWIIDRSGGNPMTTVGWMLATGSVGIMGIATGVGPVLVASALVGFGAGWGWSGLLTFAVVKDNPHAAAVATGITHTGVFIGAAVGPPAFGAVADGWSFAVAWWATAGSLLAASLIVAYVARRTSAGDRTLRLMRPSTLVTCDCDE